MKHTTLSGWQIHGVGAGTCAALVAAVYVVTIRPLMAGRAEAREIADRVAARDAERERLEDRARVIDAGLEAERARWPADAVKLRPTAEINTTLHTLATLGQTYGLVISTLEPGTTTVGPGYATTPVRLMGQGETGAVLRFLDAMHAQMGDTGVTALEVEAARAMQAEEGGGAGADSPMKFELTLGWHSVAAEGKGGAGRAGQTGK